MTAASHSGGSTCSGTTLRGGRLSTSPNQRGLFKFDTSSIPKDSLTAHNLAGEKQRVHRHYLKGSGAAAAAAAW
jgi:hypothetical protein